MSKVSFSEITNNNDLNIINNNFDLVAEAFNDNILYRKNIAGEPNALDNDIDLNSNDLLNADTVSARRLKVGGKFITPAATSTSWGNISGTIGDQEDLITKLNEYGPVVPTYAEAKALTRLVIGQRVTITDDLRGGSFTVRDVADYSAEIALDPDEGLYVTTDDGLYVLVRVIEGFITPEMFGGGEDGYIAASSFLYNLAIANGDSIPLIEIQCSGSYNFTSGITVYPWIKHKSKGAVSFNFSGMGTTGTAVTLTNNTGPASPSAKNAANTGKVFNGCFLILGAGTTGDSIGIAAGNTLDQAEERDFRDVQLGDVVVSNFATLFDGQVYDTYLMSVQNSRFETAGTTVINWSGTNVNSGERITFINDTLGGCPLGINMDADAIDINFISCSFDFCRNILIDFSASSGYQKISFVTCHLEASNDIALLRATATDRKLLVTLTDCKIVPRNNDTSLTLVRSDKKSVPRVALFQGRMGIVINGLQIGGYDYNLANAEGLFMFDDDVELISVRGIHFVGYRQAIAEKLISNFNWNFTLSGTGSIDARATKGWRNIYRSATMTGTVTTDQAFGDSSNSLAIETTTGSTDAYVIESNAFPVEGALPILNQHVVYAGGTTGDLQVQAKFRAFAEDEEADLPSITGITRSGALATVTFSTAHGLDAGQRAIFGGANQPEYNGIKTVHSIPSSTTLTFCVNDSATTPATTTDGFTGIRDKLRFLGETSALGSTFVSRYEDTEDPSYTGDRAWWAKEKFLHPSSDFYETFKGATHARLVITISELDVGDVLYLGGALANKLY